MQEEHLSVEYFDKFRKIIYIEIGINLMPHKLIMLEGRIKKRLRKLGMRSFEKYYELIQTNEKEKIEFFNVVSTNKTDFFREIHHFEIIEKYIPELIADNKISKEFKFSIWSAASSTGEEAYSLTMYLIEKFPILKTWKLKIIASDISTDVIEKAKQGIYLKNKLENIDKKYFDKYFEEYDSKSDIISMKIKKYIKFKRINLKLKEYPFNGNFEMVFCRNILIYFDNSTKLQVLKNILKYLKKGGILVLGSMERLSDQLEAELKIRKIESTVYIKL